MCELGWPGIAISEEHGGLRARGGRAGDPPGGARLRAGALADALERLRGRGDRGRPAPTSSSSAGCPGSPRARPAGRPSSPATRTRSSARPPAASSWCSPTATGAKLVETGDATLERLDLIDTTRAYYRVTADGGEPLPGEIAPAADTGMVALAAELVGVAQRALDMAVAYAKEREQFGRPIGAYQAVSHRLAEMLWEVEEARSLTYYAAWCADARARVAARSPPRWPRRAPPTPRARSPTTRSRPSAGSASPGSTTSTSCSSAPGSAPR